MKANTQIAQHFESCSLKAYPDPGAKKTPTIGWGRTRGVKLSDTCTQEQADAWLAEDMLEHSAIVDKFVKVPLAQAQYDALSDFVYNVGPGRRDMLGRPGRDGFVILRNGNPSSLLRMVNAGAFDAAAQQFGKWQSSDGKILTGLIRRRKVERLVFCGMDAGEAIRRSQDPKDQS